MSTLRWNMKVLFIVMKCMEIIHLPKSQVKKTSILKQSELNVLQALTWKFTQALQLIYFQ